MKLSNKAVYVTAIDLGCAVSIRDRDNVELGILHPAGARKSVDLQARFLGNVGPDCDFEVSALTVDGQAFLDLA